MLKIRSFRRTPEEYEWVVNLANTVWAERPTTLADWKHFERSADPDALYREIVAEVDGQCAGHMFYCEPWWWAREPGKFFFELLVHPQYQHRGVGQTLYHFVLADLACEHPRELLTYTCEDQTHTLDFLKNLGFEQTMRYPRSRLSVAEFNPSSYQGLLEKLHRGGVTIYTLAELRASDSDWKQKLYELRWEILQDVPSPEPRKKQSFGQYEKAYLGHPELLPEANFIAVAGDEYVGFSNYWPVPGGKKLNTGLTGVVRGQRRKGIATALKLRGVAYATARGVEQIETDNEENNPMYQLNLKLGFKPCPANLDFRKELDASPPEPGRRKTFALTEEPAS